MSLLLTSPAYLLAIPGAARLGRNRLVTGAALAVLVITFVNLMHFSQGWVQFGYRFSNDFVPFALAARRARAWSGRVRRRAGDRRCPDRRRSCLSVAINLWGVIWGNVLGW